MHYQLGNGLIGSLLFISLAQSVPYSCDSPSMAYMLHFLAVGGVSEARRLDTDKCGGGEN